MIDSPLCEGLFVDNKLGSDSYKTSRMAQGCFIKEVIVIKPSEGIGFES